MDRIAQREDEFGPQWREFRAVMFTGGVSDDQALQLEALAQREGTDIALATWSDIRAVARERIPGSFEAVQAEETGFSRFVIGCMVILSAACLAVLVPVLVGYFR